MRTSGRWHSRGRRIVYCAQSPAAALLETLVHFEIEVSDLPRRYRLLKLEVPEELALEHVSADDLPRNWIEKTDVTRALGDAWLANGRSPLLAVPSAVVPETFNVLLNPAHPSAARIVIAHVDEHAIDPRLLK